MIARGDTAAHVITAAMRLEAGAATRVHGVSAVELHRGAEGIDSDGVGAWRAFLIRVPEAIVPATQEALTAVEKLGNLIGYPSVVAPLVERAAAAFGGDDEVTPFSEEVWWARAIGAAVEQLTGVHPSARLVSDARRSQIEYIVHRYSSDQGLTPAAIAEAIGVSRRTLYEIADPQLGGISEYVRMVRAARAARMLADESTRRTASEIARAAGFSSPKHMSRALLALNGSVTDMTGSTELGAGSIRHPQGPEGASEPDRATA